VREADTALPPNPPFGDRAFGRGIGLTVSAALLLSLVVGCRGDHFVMPSLGMEPTIKMGSRFTIRRFEAADRLRIKRGDIVVFRLPKERDKVQVRRIVALGGDSVEIRSKHLLVNGVEPSEPYVVHTDSAVLEGPPGSVAGSRDQMPLRKVQAGRVFLLGENRDNSSDSRFWGDVPIEDLVGWLK
jgi:signal peptidase I